MDGGYTLENYFEKQLVHQDAAYSNLIYPL